MKYRCRCNQFRLEGILEGDVLESSPEPTMSAPETWKGRAVKLETERKRFRYKVTERPAPGG